MSPTNLFKFPLLVIASVTLFASACTYKGPRVVIHPELDSSDPVVAAALETPPTMSMPEHGVVVASPYTAKPVVELELQDRWVQSGTTTEIGGVHRVRLLAQGADTMAEWRPFHVKLPPEAGDAAIVHRCVLEVPPTALESANTEIEVYLEVHRLNAPVQTVPFLVRLAWVPLTTAAEQAPVDTAVFRRDLLGFTYIIWGLPRDLLDVPFTFLNQLGFGQTSHGSEEGHLVPGITYAAAGLTGTFLGAYWGISAGMTNVVKVMVLGGVGAFGGAIGGLLVGVAADYLYGKAIQPTQVALLRSGANGEWNNRNSTVRVHGEWDDAELADYARVRRTWDYFPNWKHIAHRRSFAPASAASVNLSPVVVSLEPSALVGP